LAEELDDWESFDIGLPTSFFDDSTDDVSEVVRGLAERIADSESVEIHELELEMGEITNAHPLLSSPEFSWLQRQSLTVRGQGTQYNPEFRAAQDDIQYNDHIALRKLPSAYIDDLSDGESYLLGRREEIRFKQHLLEQFETVDLLLTPTLQSLPPERGKTGATHEGIIRMTGNTGPISRVGFPVISVPAGEQDGIPVGAQLIAPGREDLRVLQGAKLVEDFSGAA
jgi:aspartyl-tRNA(Asn)/glutamyl-tRNA(Gln) amidotransferase subunit A